MKSLDSIFCLCSFSLRQTSVCEEKILELLCVEAAGASAKEQKSRIVDSISCGSRLKEETKLS